MADATFYILSTESLRDRFLFACKLMTKAYRQGQYCYVYTDSAEQSRLLDELLWTFQPTLFIPHQIYDEEQLEPIYQQCILIGTKTAPKAWQRLIFNLSSHYPDDLTQTERVLEILDEDEHLKKQARQRYLQYKKQDFTMTSHHISP